jgi:hypothetical protein
MWLIFVVVNIKLIIYNIKLPFTSKAAGSNLSENFSMWLEPSPHVKRVKVNALPKVVGFLRVLRVSSHRESWQGGLGT